LDCAPLRSSAVKLVVNVGMDIVVRRNDVIGLNERPVIFTVTIGEISGPYGFPA
jgi:hypothetical protein